MSARDNLVYCILVRTYGCILELDRERAIGTSCSCVQVS